jgi:hypothetical protein
MKAAKIKELKGQGFTPDQVYALAAQDLGLLTITFHGHRGTRKTKNQLNTAWKRITNIFSL